MICLVNSILFFCLVFFLIFVPNIQSYCIALDHRSYMQNEAFTADPTFNLTHNAPLWKVSTSQRQLM